MLSKEELYALQEAVLLRLQKLPNSPLSVAKLCGGTALARCWLDHRVSFDLDFFFPVGFDAGQLAKKLKQTGIVFDVKGIVDDPKKANQLHGFIRHDGQLLNVSFVEDAYFEVFPAVSHAFGAALVRTEEVPGLYHRKLRTVSGAASEGEVVVGGRQKARDLFDLYVLSHRHQPIRKFIASLPYVFPSDAFDNGLASMPWFDLMDELSEIACNRRWVKAKDIGFLQSALLQQIGAT